MTSESPNRTLHPDAREAAFRMETSQPRAGELGRSPLASLGENAAVEQELLFPFAPLRENKEFETDALWALLNCRITHDEIIKSLTGD